MRAKRSWLAALALLAAVGLLVTVGAVSRLEDRPAAELAALFPPDLPRDWQVDLPVAPLDASLFFDTVERSSQVWRGEDGALVVHAHRYASPLRAAIGQRRLGRAGEDSGSDDLGLPLQQEYGADRAVLDATGCIDGACTWWRVSIRYGQYLVTVTLVTTVSDQGGRLVVDRLPRDAVDEAAAHVDRHVTAFLAGAA